MRELNQTGLCIIRVRMIGRIFSYQALNDRIGDGESELFAKKYWTMKTSLKMNGGFGNGFAGTGNECSAAILRVL